MNALMALHYMTASMLSAGTLLAALSVIVDLAMLNHYLEEIHVKVARLSMLYHHNNHIILIILQILMSVQCHPVRMQFV